MYLQQMAMSGSSTAHSSTSLLPGHVHGCSRSRRLHGVAGISVTSEAVIAPDVQSVTAAATEPLKRRRRRGATVVDAPSSSSHVIIPGAGSVQRPHQDAPAVSEAAPESKTPGRRRGSRKAPAVGTSSQVEAGIDSSSKLTVAATNGGSNISAARAISRGSSRRVATAGKTTQAAPSRAAKAAMISDDEAVAASASLSPLSSLDAINGSINQQEQTSTPPATAADLQVQALDAVDTLQQLQQQMQNYNQSTPPAVLATAIKLSIKLLPDSFTSEEAQLSMQLLKTAWQLQEQQLESCTPADLAIMVRAICRAPGHILQLYQSVVTQDLVPLFLHTLANASSKDIALTLHGLAKGGLQLQPYEVWEVLEAFIAVLDDAVPRTVCMALWGVARMRQDVEQKQLQQILDAFVDMQPDNDAVNMAQYALRQLGYDDWAAELRREYNRQLVAQQAGQQEVSTPKLLTSRICNCRQLSELQNLVNQHAASLNAIHSAAAMHQAVKLAGQSSDRLPTLQQLFDQLWTQQEARLLDCAPVTLASIMQTFVKAPDAIQQQYPGLVLQQLLPAFLQQLPRAGLRVTVLFLQHVAQATADITDSAGTADVAELRELLLGIVQQLIEHILEHQQRLSPATVVTVLQAVAQTEHRLQEQQIQQLLEVFVKQKAPMSQVETAAAALQGMGLQEHADALLQQRQPPPRRLRLKELSHNIRRCSSLQQLQHLIEQEQENLNHIHLRTAIQKAVELSYNSTGSTLDVEQEDDVQHLEQDMVLQHQLLQQLWQLLQKQLPDCSNTTIAVVTQAVCTAPAAVQAAFWPEVIQQLLPALLSKQDRFQPAACAAVLHTVASLREQRQHQSHFDRTFNQQQVWGLVDAVFMGRNWLRLLPRELCSAVWAAAKLQQSLPGQNLQQVVTAVVDSLQPAPQVSATCIAQLMWGVAALGHRVPAQQLQQLLRAFLQGCRSVSVATVADVLWAVAEMDSRLQEQQLQQLVTSLADKLSTTSTTAAVAVVASVACACAKLRYLPEQILSHPKVVAGVSTVAGPEQVVSIAWACGQFGYADKQLLNAVLQRTLHLQGLSAQSPLPALATDAVQSQCSMREVVDVCWAVAMLNLQRHADSVLVLLQHMSAHWDDEVLDSVLLQLHQIHNWLLSCKGLRSSTLGLYLALSPEQMQRCEQAQAAAITAEATVEESWLELAIFSAVQQLPVTWQDPPRPKQYSNDRSFVIDIIAKTAAGELLALFVDDSNCFRQPDGLPMGPIQYRNRYLAAQGYKVVSISSEAWRQFRGNEELQQGYLMQQLTGPCESLLQQQRLREQQKAAWLDRQSSSAVQDGGSPAGQTDSNQSGSSPTWTSVRRVRRAGATAKAN